MSWCGVKVDKYRADIVLRRDAWHDVAAIRAQRVVAISEEFLGRPGPRLVEGYRQLRTAIAKRSEEHTSELQSLMRISYAVFCLKKKTTNNITTQNIHVDV